MITIKDIAKRAGVSYATVSRALNDRSDVNPQTRERILALAKEMGYQPNMIARSLVNQRSNIIALIVPDMANPYFADIARSVSDHAASIGYTTTVCNTGWDPKRELEMLHLMQEQRVAGIIIKPTAFYEAGTFDQLTVPLVVFWHPSDEAESSTFIEVDHRHGTELAIRELVQRGCQRIAYLGGQGTSPANQLRLMAYQEELQRNGLQVYPELISYGGFNVESGYERIKIMMDKELKPDGCFCGNDYIALGVLRYLREHGIENFHLIGYDDIFFASLPMIGLSTIRQPRDLLGQKAVEALDQAIKIFPERHFERILIEPSLVVRET